MRELRRLSIEGEVDAGNLKAGASGAESFLLARCDPSPDAVGRLLVPVFRRGVFGTDEFGGKEEPINGDG